MYKSVLLTLGFVLTFSDVAFAQPNVTFDSPFLVHAATALKKRDVINITNAGARGTNGDICANVYVFEPGGQMLECCSCVVPPNVLRSLSVATDLLEGRKAIPKAMVFKILASTPVVGSCNGSTPGALTSGLVAWKGEVAFTPATLSAGELSGLTSRCGFLHGVANICPICR